MGNQESPVTVHFRFSQIWEIEATLITFTLGNIYSHILMLISITTFEISPNIT